MKFGKAAFLLSLVAGSGLVLSSSLTLGEAKAVKAADEVVAADSSRNATYLTTRVFVSNSNAGNWQSNGAKTGIRVWDETGAATLYDTNWVNAGTEEAPAWVGYADIPVTGLAGVQLIRVNPNDLTEYWNYAPNFDLTGSWSSAIHSLSEYNWNWTYEDLKIDYCSPEFAAILLEGYSACLASEINGFLAYPTLEENFFSKMGNEALNTQLGSEYSYLDYASNGYVYDENVSKGDSHYTVRDKIAQMKASYEAYEAGTSAQAAAFVGKENGGYWIVGAVSLLAVAVVVGGWSFLQQRKKKTI